MAQKIYEGVNNVARNTIKAYGEVNNKARTLIKGFVGDAQGKARQFWGRPITNYLKLNFEQNSAGTYNLGLADVALTARYAMEQFVLIGQTSIYPRHITNLKKNIDNISRWARNLVPDGALTVVRVFNASGSTVDSTAWITVQICYIEEEYYSRTVTIGSEIIDNGFGSYNYPKTWPESGTIYSDYWKMIRAEVKLDGVYYDSQIRSIVVSIPNALNFVGTNIDYGATFTKTVSVPNLGVYFTEYELPQGGYPRYQDYTLYWDFNLTRNRVDYNRNILIQTDGNLQYDQYSGRYYYATTVTLPTWIASHLFASILIEFTVSGELQLYYTQNQQTGKRTYYDTTLFTYRDRYYFDVTKTEDNKAFGKWRWFNTSFGDESEWEDHGISRYSFSVDYEGVTGDGVDYNYCPSGTGDKIQITHNVFESNHAFWLEVFAARVRIIPFDPTDVYFYARYELQYSPEGTDIQYNYIKSGDPADFVEYFGTNKTFIQVLSGSGSGVWSLDTRNFGGYARRYIRSPGNNGYSTRIYIPVEHIDNANGKYIRFSARTYNGETIYSAGVAYINGNNLVTEEVATGTLRAQLERFGGQIRSSQIDYLWIEDYGDGKTIMTSCIKISATSDEAFH